MGKMGELFTSLKEAEEISNSKKAFQLTRSTDPGTSYEAGAQVVHKLRALQIIVLNHLRAAGDIGLADIELEELCGDHGSTYRTRRAELVEKKLVVDSGRKKIIQGRKRIVWVAK